MLGGSTQLSTMLSQLGSALRFDYCVLDSNRKLRGAAEHLIDGSEKRTSRLAFEFKQKFGFIKRVDQGRITTVKDLES